jgi:L-ascorbate metabolism protein UlaG (beta-lactamase superfamily)
MKKETIQYAYNKSLPVVKSGWKGNLLIDNRFCNADKQEHYKFRDIFKWWLSKNPQKSEKKADTFKVEVIPNHTFSKSGSDKIVWLGHNSFYIRLNGISFITDPSFYRMLMLKRMAGMPCSVQEIFNIDYLLVSHNHRDHLDKKSLKDLVSVNPNMKALIPLRMGKFIGKIVKEYEEAGWYQQFILPGKVRVYLMPAMHWSGRGMFDHNESLWGSYIIQTDSVTIFFAGDTRQGVHFAEIATFFPKIDYALMPIGAYKPSNIMEIGHISPTEVVKSSNTLKPVTFIPMHYGAYDLSDEPISEPYREIIRLKKEGKLNATLRNLKIGEELLIK